jgi:hypothetical protein
MDTLWTTALWKQFGATIDMLDNTVVACPDSLWQERLWRDPPPLWFPPKFAEFWYVTFHTLVWLDLYLSGVPEAEFAPPAPFAQGVIDSAEATPDRPYTREELRAYLASLRQKCRDAIATLTEEQARRPVSYPWMREDEVVTYAELLLYNLRHVQGHAAELSLFLGQHGVQTLDWTTRAPDHPNAD